MTMKTRMKVVVAAIVAVLMVVAGGCVDQRKKVEAGVKELKKALPLATPVGNMTDCSIEKNTVKMEYEMNEGIDLEQAKKNAPILYMSFGAMSQTNEFFKAAVEVGYDFNIVYKSGDDKMDVTISNEDLLRGRMMDESERNAALTDHYVGLEKESCEAEEPTDEIQSMTAELIGDYVTIIADMNIDENAAEEDVNALFEQLGSESLNEILFSDESIFRAASIARCGKGYAFRYRNPLKPEQYVEHKMTAKEILEKFEAIKKGIIDSKK